MKRRANGKGSTKAPPEFKVLEAIKWKDDTRA